MGKTIEIPEPTFDQMVSDLSRLENAKEIVETFFEKQASRNWFKDYSECYETLGKLKAILVVDKQ